MAEKLHPNIERQVRSFVNAPQGMAAIDPYVAAQAAEILWQRRFEIDQMFAPAPKHYSHEFLPTSLRGHEAQFSNPYVADIVYAPLGAALRDNTFSLINHKGSVDLPRGLVKEKTTDVIQHSVQDLNPNSKEAEQIAGFAPKLVKVLVSSNDVVGISQEYVGDLVRYAVEAVRDPSLIGDTTIRTGFGGTDDPELITRFPAYLLPAISMWKNIRSLQLEMQKTGIDVGTPPRLEFFFAPYAGIYANDKDAEKVVKNARDGERLAASFIQDFYPELVDHVQFRFDKPLPEDDPLSQIVLDYLADIVNQSDSEDVEKIVEALQKLGHNHGQEKGRSLAAHYGAIHPVVFGDQIETPHPSIIDKDTRTKVSITIGGRPERLFNGIRTAASENANAQGFVTFADLHPKITPALRGEIATWAQVLEQKTAAYTPDTQSYEREHLPFLVLPFMCKTGAYPVYYATRFDTWLSDPSPDILYNIRGVDRSSLSIEERSMLDAVEHDISELVKAIGEEGIVRFVDKQLTATV